jgi:hypothetical protein
MKAIFRPYGKTSFTLDIPAKVPFGSELFSDRYGMLRQTIVPQSGSAPFFFLNNK